MKRIVRGVCGLLSAVMLLSTTAMAADYTPVVTSDERVDDGGIESDVFIG